MSTHNFSHLVCDKKKAEEEKTSSTKGHRNWMSTQRRMKLDPYLSPCKKKSPHRSNVKPKTTRRKHKQNPTR